jgi:hypothetical protein
MVAAHIIPRALCTEEERRDFDAVAMPACLLGCDALFEHGYLTVGADGVIGAPTDVRQWSEMAAGLAGRVAPGWSPQRAAHFAWHRARHGDHS